MLDVRTYQRFHRTDTERRKSVSTLWTSVVFAGGLIGAVCGAVGIFWSLITMLGLITLTRVAGNITLALFGIALSALFAAAHGMDKISEIEKRRRHKRLTEQMSNNNRFPHS